MAATFIAVAVGWVGLRSWVARVVIVCVTLALGVALLPPVTQALSSAAGVGAVIWRVWWVLPVPLLVAGVTGTVANLVQGRWRPAMVISTAVVVGVLPLWGGRWIGSSGNHARWSSPVAWKTPLGSESGARLALSLSEGGDVVLAPDYPSRVLAGMSVDVHPVVARRLYLRQYFPVEGALAAERGQLQDFANERLLPAGTLGPLLEQLSVDTVCLARDRAEARAVLEEVGYRQVVEEGDLVCARRGSR
jgi:hypothetical protein